MEKHAISNVDSNSIKETITEFYKLAGIPPIVIQGDINQETVEVFLKMYEETVECSKAFALVPRPPTGPASITWLVTQLGGAVMRSYKGKLSITCAKGVIYRWGRQLRMAIEGI